MITESVPFCYIFQRNRRYKFDASLSTALKRGGGVGAMYKSSMTSENVRSSHNHCEYADYDITTRGAKFRLGLIHYPPTSRQNGFTKNIFIEQWPTYVDTLMLDHISRKQAVAVFTISVIFARIRRFLSLSVAKTIATALVRSRLYY